MASENNFIIRTMTREDLDQAFSLSLSEGWNQTPADWKFLFGNSSSICIVAEKEGRVAGTATAIIYDSRVAWIGMVLVDKILRGQGAGKMLMEEIIRRLGTNVSIKLDATPAGEPLYAKLGFIPEYRILRMTCQTRMTASVAEDVLPVLPLTREDLPEITEYDIATFGADRTQLLRRLAADNPGLGFGCRENNVLKGFILGRSGSRFTYVGPVEAESTAIAKILIFKTMQQYIQYPAAIDVPEDKTDLTLWLESTGFVVQRYFTRMYLGRNPYPGNIVNQYLISGPEFG